MKKNNQTLTKIAHLIRFRYCLALLLLLVNTFTQAEVKLNFIQGDHLGTPRALSDNNGETVWQLRQIPFGEATVDEDPDGDGSDVVANLRFPGQYFDAETGLHYNYFRYYDPRTGRYLRSDPIGLLGGLNPYLYADANPIRFTDKFGLRANASASASELPLYQEAVSSTSTSGPSTVPNTPGLLNFIFGPGTAVSNNSVISNFGAFSAGVSLYNLSQAVVHARDTGNSQAMFNFIKDFTSPLASQGDNALGDAFTLFSDFADNGIHRDSDNSSINSFEIFPPDDSVIKLERYKELHCPPSDK